MRPEQASQTALLIAGYRARASRQKNALFNDPWAEAIAGEAGKALTQSLDRVFDKMELWVAVRTAFLDAHVAAWTPSRKQVVLLGAGLDTRAARLATPGVSFFEVDHPSTQEDKKRRVAALAGYPRDCAAYVACDFEKDDFLTKLEAAGFRTGEPALILWEGVTPYLPEVAIRATLRRIAQGCEKTSILIFDHLLKKVRTRENPKDDAQSFVDGLGEQVVWGTNDVLPMLYEEGFRHVRSLSFDEACLSLTGTYDRANEFRFQRLVITSKTAPSVL